VTAAMPLQNRVTPFGELVAAPARGLLFGNRGGRFHDRDARTLRRRRWASKQWICCVLDFKGRHRAVWRTGYTELFFLDEVTALAAGHRPCCECRRLAARAFQASILHGHPGRSPRVRPLAGPRISSAESRDPPARTGAVDPGSALRAVRDDSRLMPLKEIDAHLHRERLDGRAKRRHRVSADELPDGAVIALDGGAFAIRGGAMRPSFLQGYGAPRPRPSGMVDVLTPPLTLAALGGGYAPLWHPTALDE
jgi:hypothetical protein